MASDLRNCNHIIFTAFSLHVSHCPEVSLFTCTCIPRKCLLFYWTVFVINNIDLDLWGNFTVIKDTSVPHFTSVINLVKFLGGPCPLHQFPLAQSLHYMWVWNVTCRLLWNIKWITSSLHNTAFMLVYFWANLIKEASNITAVTTNM